MAKQTVQVVFDGQDKTGNAVKSLRGNLNSANQAVGKIKSSLGGMTSAIGLAAGAAGFGLMAKKALATADALAKTANKLGVTSSELYTFQTQAELAGIKTDTANMALQRFVRRTAEAAQGTGEAKNALIELGLNAGELQKLPLPERMKALADAFAKVKSPADRLRIAFKLFDSEGASMVNMLGDGSDSLEDVEDKMKDLGIEIKRGSLPQVEAFNDSMTLLRRTVEAAMINAMSKATPQLERVTKKLQELAVPLTGKVMDGFEFLLDNLPTITKFVKAFIAIMVVSKVVNFALALIQLGKALMTVRVAAIAVQAAMGPVGIAFAGISALAAFFASDLAEASDSLDDFTGFSDDATDSTGDLEDALNGLKDEAEAVNRPLEDHGDTLDDVTDETIDATVETNEFAEALKKLREEVNKPKQAIEDFNGTLKELQDQFAKGEISVEEYNRVLAQLVKQLTGVSDELQDNKDRQEALTRAIEASIAAGGDNEAQIAAMRRELEKLQDEAEIAELRTKGLTDAQIDLLQQIRAGSEGVNEYSNAVANLDNLLANKLITTQEYNDALADLTSKMTGIVNPMREAQREVEILEQQIRALEDSTDGGSRELEVLRGRLEEAQGAVEDLNSSMGTRAVDEYFEAIANGASPSGALNDLKEKLESINGPFNDVFGPGAVAKIHDFFDAIGAGSVSGGALDLLNDALDGLEGAFAQFFADGELKFSSFVDSIIAGLQAIAAEAIVSVGLNFVKNLIPGLATGGMVEGFAGGGRISGPGGPREDKIPAMLSNGEYVIQASTVRKFGSGFFDVLNSGNMPGFAGGGMAVLPDFGSVATPGIGQILGVINAIIYIFNKLFGGMTDGEKANALLGEIIVWTRTSVDAALDGIQEVFGSRPYQEIINDIKGPDDPSPITVEETIADDIWSGIISSGDPLDKFIKVAEGIEGIGTGLAEELYNLIGRALGNFVFDLPNFNLDQEFANMYMSAAGIVGRQYGGPLERGQASVVGETGPELFIPGRSGTVSPIASDGGKALITAVREVKDEVAALRRQMDRQQPARLVGGRN